MSDKDFFNKQFRGSAGRIAAFVVGLAICGMLTWLFGEGKALKRENAELREEIARQQQYVPLKRDTIRDTVEVVTQKVVEVERIKEVLTKEDKELLKDLDVKLKDLQAYQKMSMETSAEVEMKATPDDDSVLTYNDEWLDLRYDKETSGLTLRARDSLAITVEKEYRKRFLWWRWGVKGYEVKAVSFSPYTTIRYNNYIKKKE